MCSAAQQKYLCIKFFSLFSKECGMIDCFSFVHGSMSPVLSSCFQLENGEPVPCSGMLTHIQGSCHSFHVLLFTLVWLVKQKKKVSSEQMAVVR